MQATVEVLARLGVDPEVDDERVDHLLRAIETAQVDDLGSYSDGLHSPVMTGFYRIISACDPEVEGKLALRAPQVLVDKVLPGLREVALEFTDGEEYTEPSRFPVKAEHTVTDPASPFWGFGISTDTHPGWGLESVYVRMPSGLTTGDEILRTAGDVGSDSFLKDDLRYFPREIIVQGIQVGRVSSFTRQVDTDGGLVADFIDLVKSQNGATSPGATSPGSSS